MTVKEKMEMLHDKVKSFEYRKDDIDNGLLAFLEKDIYELRILIGNVVTLDTKLNTGDKELYLDKFDAPLALLYKFSKQSTPEERLRKLPAIKESVNTGIDLFFTACKNAQSDVIFKEESKVTNVSYPYAIKEGLTSVFSI